MGTNPNLVVFYKNAMDMDMLTWCKWKNFVLDFFDGSLQPHNKIKLNAQHNKHLGICLLLDIFIVVQSNFTFKSSITNIGCHWTIWFLLVNSKQLHMPKWHQMAKQLHLSQQPNIMYMILIIIYCFDQKKLLIFYLNNHYRFVQDCSSLAIFLF